MSNDLLEGTLERLFTDRSGPEVRQEAEEGRWPSELWDELVKSDLAYVSVSERAGGGGGSLDDAAVLCRLAGRHAVPLPLAECALLGGWLLDATGLSLPRGPLSVAVPRADDSLVLEHSKSGWTVSGQLAWVPFGRVVTQVIGFADGPDGPRVVALEPGAATLHPNRNLAGEPRDRLNFDRIVVPDDRIGLPQPGMAWQLELRGALSRALLIGGALETVSEMTVAYANQRQQFGRPIASFQAVANRLVRLASEAELAVLAALAASQRFAEVGPAAAFEVAAANATASRAASEVTAEAHQVHAAIGMTREYPLHHFTRRLWAWRQEWGSERRWARYLGEEVGSSGAEMLWPRISSSV
jgi:acyl-CoA dehydrogenase